MFNSPFARLLAGTMESTSLLSRWTSHKRDLMHWDLHWLLQQQVPGWYYLHFSCKPSLAVRCSIMESWFFSNMASAFYDTWLFARIEHVAPRQSNLPHWQVQVTTWQKVHLQLFGQCHLVETIANHARIHEPSLPWNVSNSEPLTDYSCFSIMTCTLLTSVLAGFHASNQQSVCGTGNKTIAYIAAVKEEITRT